MLDRTTPEDPVALARAHGRSAVMALVNALDSSDGQVVIQAAVALLNFGFGAPDQRTAIVATRLVIEAHDAEPELLRRPNGEAAAWNAC